MNPKRKGFIWAAIFFSFVLFILSISTLGIALHDILNKTRRVVHEVVELWQVILWEIIVLSVLSGILGLYTLWSVIRARKKNKSAAILIIVGHILLLGSALYVTLTLDKLHAARDISPTELFLLTNRVIRDGRMTTRDSQFVPAWLDHVQRNDPKCCGVRTFRDWNTFWAPLKDTFPKSCCQPQRANCTTSSVDIAYPVLLGQNIKTDGGCYTALVSRVKDIILQSKKFSSLLTVGIGVSLAAVLALYLVVFYLKRPRPGDGGAQDECDDSDGDEDDGPIPKFPADQLTWRNLEFYRVLVKRKKKPKRMDNFASGSESLEPLGGTSSNFQTSMDQFGQQQQSAPVEYRVDILSPSTILPPPPPATTNQVTPTNQPLPPIQDVVSDVDMSGQEGQGVGSGSDTDDGQDRKNRTNLQGIRKPRHRHHHRRKDWQENDVENPPPN